jgi:hypothetical protein
VNREIFPEKILKGEIFPQQNFFHIKSSGRKKFRSRKNPVLKFFKRKNFPVKFSSAKKVREKRAP